MRTSSTALSAIDSAIGAPSLHLPGIAVRMLRRRAQACGLAPCFHGRAQRILGLVEIGGELRRLALLRQKAQPGIARALADLGLLPADDADLGTTQQAIAAAVRTLFEIDDDAHRRAAHDAFGDAAMPFGIAGPAAARAFALDDECHRATHAVSKAARRDAPAMRSEP